MVQIVDPACWQVLPQREEHDHSALLTALRFLEQVGDAVPTLPLPVFRSHPETK